MRWAYKTIHYGLKKDGLLGGSFLDENEMEESLNEYGESGWELVSLLEVRDGVIAVFKTSIDEYQEHHAPSAAEPKKNRDDCGEECEGDNESDQPEEVEVIEEVEDVELAETGDENEVEADNGETDNDDINRDIGTIRIE